jgi:hypothetical protein
LVLVNSSDDSPPGSSFFPPLPPLCLAVSFPCNSCKIIKGGGFQVHLHNGEQQHVVGGGSAGTKRRAAAVLTDFGFKAKPGAPSWGVVERKAKGVQLDTVVSGSAGKRRRKGDNRNDRNCKRRAQ